MIAPTVVEPSSQPRPFLIEIGPSTTISTAPARGQTRAMVRNALVVAGIVAGITALGSGIAAADQVSPDLHQPGNGDWAPGYPTGPYLTPSFSPIQVPAQYTTNDGRTTVVTAFPSLSPWVHNLVPVDPDSTIELRGAVRATVPNPATGGALVVNPNGHCIFDGRNVAAGQPVRTTTALRPIRVDVPGFGLTIEPIISHR